MSTAPPTPPGVGSDDDRWVVRAKKKRSAAGLAPAVKLKAHTIRIPAFADNRPQTPHAVQEVDGRPKRWLALGLAGMIYAVGAAGLWSIVQTFEQPSSLSITPARDNGILPPLDEGVDMRDARFDQEAQPEIISETGRDDDVSSDEQENI